MNFWLPAFSAAVSESNVQCLRQTPKTLFIYILDISGSKPSFGTVLAT